MKTASGSSRTNDAWEPPAFVAPRGLKEHLWLVLLALSVLGALMLRGGWYILICTAILLLFLRIPSRAILGAGAIWLLIGLAANSTTSTTLWDLLVAASWWGAPTMDPTFMDGLARIGLAIGLGLLCLGTAHAFDTRAVDRDKVDARVWERQTRQRRRVLRRWAKQRSVPEVLP